VDDSSRGALTAAGLPCGSCGTELAPNSKFCNECGAPVTQVSRSAEYKQVTVLFADAVHSMDIASAVGAERLGALLAQAHGDDAAYRDYRDRYRAMATSLGFEGHTARAEAMT
jgi:zinc-ribbon domain